MKILKNNLVLFSLLLVKPAIRDEKTRMIWKFKDKRTS